MKRIVILLAAMIALCGCSALSKINWDPQYLAYAANSALTAASMTDAQVAALSVATVQQLDAQNKIDNGAYLRRLNRVMAGINEVGGLKLNYKVYQTKEVNAFACGDGSIRVYSGLMDVMDDNELLAVIGHEVGHVMRQHSMKAMRSAYLATAARGVIAAAGGTVGTLAASQLGEIGEAYLSSQFSQKQELEADDYGFSFAIEHGKDPYSMYQALEKLNKLSQGSQASAMQQMFSSHPDSQTRAARMKEKTDNYVKKNQ